MIANSKLKYYLLALISVVSALVIEVYAQSYDVALHAKILNEEQVFTIVSTSEATLTVKKSILIKSKKADKGLKGINLYYDDFHSIESAEVIVINPLTKKVIQKYRLKDFEDVNYDFTNLASDSRSKRVNPSLNHYPYQLEISYKLKYKGLLFYPIWYENTYTNTEVVKSSFTVIDQTKSTFRYMNVAIQEPKVAETENAITYFWEVEDLKVKQLEKFGNTVSDYTGYVITAPRNFEIDGYTGNMESWLDFGNWIMKLNSTQNNLQKQHLADLSDQIASLTAQEDKVKAVYHYLQSNSRYISIQLGIGGWQPLSTAFVHEKKYGDCKALTFYTQALLEFYGIESFYTLINGGKKNAVIREDFPSPHFNHAILTVPMEQDTIFLECTSQTNPFGYLGTFTSDRAALLVQKNASKLIHTKKYTAEKNIQISHINLILEENGQAKVSATKTFKGIEIENHNFLSLYQKDTTEWYKWYADRINHGGKKIERFQLTTLKEGFIPSAGFKSSFTIFKEAKLMGKRMFIAPSNYTNNYLTNLPENSSRKTNINIEYGYNQFDTLVYQLPKHYAIESGQKAISIQSDYGTYQRTIELKENKLFYYRSFLLRDGDYPATVYNEYRDFLNEVRKADRQKIVLLSKT